MLSDTDLRRYSRQLMLSEIGTEGQEKLAASSVLVVGAGGLGSAVLTYLAVAGIGRIGIIDHDHVELSNLQRQIVHEYADQGRLKVESAADRISELNPDVAVDIYPRRVTAENAASIFRNYDIVADGCDHFPTRLIVNAACVALNIPLVSAAVVGFSGQLGVFHPAKGGGCYQCLVPEVPPEANRCTEVGVVGPICGMMGSLQALEIMKVLLGRSDSLRGKLLRYNALKHEHRISQLAVDAACPVCGACALPANCA